MKKYAIQKQYIPVGQSNDPTWASRQIWVFKINSEDTVDDFDTLEEAQSKRDELEENDPTPRVYRIIEYIDESTYTII